MNTCWALEVVYQGLDNPVQMTEVYEMDVGKGLSKLDLPSNGQTKAFVINDASFLNLQNKKYVLFLGTKKEYVDHVYTGLFTMYRMFNFPEEIFDLE